MNIFTQMRTPSRNWWYHRKIRRMGDVEEARRREHQSVRAVIQDARDCKRHGGTFSEAEFLSGGARLRWTETTDTGRTTHSAPVWPEQEDAIRSFMSR